MREPSLPTLLFYCQHSLGIGHLTRSFALAQALSRHFRVVFLNGGRLPPGVPVPAAIERIDLPPLGMDDGHTVVSRDGQLDVARAQAERRRLIDAAVRRTRPAVLLVELFPFGRKKFAGEILPMIRAARSQPGRRAGGLQPARHPRRCAARPAAPRRPCALADRPLLRRRGRARRRGLRTAGGQLPPGTADAHAGVHSGYVVPGARTRRAGAARRAPAGLGRRRHRRRARCSAPHWLRGSCWRGRCRCASSPALPARASVAGTAAQAAGVPGVELVRHVPDMVAEMRRARASISQCGYNTALDLVVAGVPALVVPYETVTENEQRGRAERLAGLGAMLCLPAGNLQPQPLAHAIERLLAFTPLPAALALDGAQRSADWLAERLQARHTAPEAACATN
jgi:predicted glycosyltransferase